MQRYLEVKKYQKEVKKRSKLAKKKKKKIAHRDAIFLQNFLYNTHKSFKVHYINLKYVIKGHWRSNKDKKGKNCQDFENTSRNLIFKIIPHMKPTRLFIM